MDLTLLMAGVLAFAILMYVLLDGFDLGVGMLSALVPEPAWRDRMVDSIAPVWDGNETWLILGGAILFAAFPAAYGLVLPALYLPVIGMLLALIFRGVAFEFRVKARRSRRLWDFAFAAGSGAAAFLQGVLLGIFITGIGNDAPLGLGSAIFPMLTGVALMAGYALLGATWIVLKTDGPLRDWAARCSRQLLLVVMAGIAMISAVTPLASAAVAERWFGDLWRTLALAPVPLITAGVAWWLWRALAGSRDGLIFRLSQAVFGLGFIGLGVSLWPYAVPFSMTIWDAAAPASSLAFTAVAVVCTLPLVLIYTGYAYLVFRGKIREGEGYH